MSKARFEAALFEGHESVTAVIVPVDPEEVWELKPVKLAPRNGRADAADVPPVRARRTPGGKASR